MISVRVRGRFWDTFPAYPLTKRAPDPRVATRSQTLHTVHTRAGGPRTGVSLQDWDYGIGIPGPEGEVGSEDWDVGLGIGSRWCDIRSHPGTPIREWGQGSRREASRWRRGYPSVLVASALRYRKRRTN